MSVYFQVKCFSIDQQHNCSTHTNGSTHSVKIEKLVPGINYNIEVAAQTKKGTGKWSTAYALGLLLFFWLNNFIYVFI